MDIQRFNAILFPVTGQKIKNILELLSTACGDRLKITTNFSELSIYNRQIIPEKANLANKKLPIWIRCTSDTNRANKFRAFLKIDNKRKMLFSTKKVVYLAVNKPCLVLKKAVYKSPGWSRRETTG